MSPCVRSIYEACSANMRMVTTHLALRGCRALALVVLFSACVCSKQCKNIPLNSKQGLEKTQDLSCSRYLDSVGLLPLYNTQATPYITCQHLQEKYMQGLHQQFNNTDGTYQCTCWPGYTDSLSTSTTSGIVTLLSEFDIRNIRCKTPCHDSYENVLKIVDSSACACVNRQGCMFQERTAMRGYDPVVQINAVLVLSSNLLVDSHISHCTQFSETYEISLQEILICQRSAIEYIFYAPCELSCDRDPHMVCLTNPSTGLCDVTCRDGFYANTSSADHSITCRAHTRCGKNTFMGDSHLCLPCTAGKYREIIPVTLFHSNYNEFQSQFFCVACPSGKYTTVPGGDCTGASTSLSTASAPSVETCTMNGFGWDEQHMECRICPLHSFSYRNSSILKGAGNVCQSCALDEFTHDIGSTLCLSCPPFLVRQSVDGDVGCQGCGTGLFYDTATARCRQCGRHEVAAPYSLGCTECSLVHYANANRSFCLPCERGKIRQSQDGFESCRLCPVDHFLQGIECERCIAPQIQCVEGFFFDTCENTTRARQEGCVCGCTPCYWQRQYQGFMENFVTAPGCSPSCGVGHKMLIRRTKDIECMPQRELMPRDRAANTKFTSTDDSDLTMYSCVSFLRVSQVDIFSAFHMQTCLRALSANCIKFSSNVLVNYLADYREIQDMDENCFFECIPGYGPGKTPGLGHIECVPLPVATCTEYQNEYQTQQCDEYWT